MKSAIVDSGASSYFFTKNAPKQNVDPIAPRIQVGTAYGQPINSEITFYISIPQLPYTFHTTDHVMLGFQENL